MEGQLREGIQTLLTGIIVCVVAVKNGAFKSIIVEVGFHQYAELVDSTTLLKMPFNAIVNIGYVLVGIYWLLEIRKSKISSDGQHYFDMLSMMSMMYGPVQYLRITTQSRMFTILDQWFTLPIFAWACLFGLYVLSGKRHPISETVILCLSVLSYLLVLLSSIGFEIALGIHIFIGIVISLTCQLKIGTNKSWKHMVFAVLCCMGFVLLKIYDIELGKKHWIFKRLSGHFLSKLCDIMQIHFVAKFFEEILKKQLKRK